MLNPIRLAARLLWPLKPNVGLARLTGRPRSTVRSWQQLHRRMPSDFLRMLAACLYRYGGDLALSLAQELERRAKQQDAEVRTLRGFCEVKMRNDIMQDGRWRSGRRRYI